MDAFALLSISFPFAFKIRFLVTDPRVFSYASRRTLKSDHMFLFYCCQVENCHRERPFGGNVSHTRVRMCITAICMEKIKYTYVGSGFWLMYVVGFSIAYVLFLPFSLFFSLFVHKKKPVAVGTGAYCSLFFSLFFFFFFFQAQTRCF